MDLKSLKIKEKQIVDDVNEFFLLYSLDDMDSSDEIQDGLNSIGQIGKDCRHIHIQLKEEMGEETEFVEFDAILAKIRKYQKDAKTFLKTIPKNQEDLLATTKIKLDEDKERHRLENVSMVRNSVLVEESVFCEKLRMKVADFDMTSIISIQKKCIRFEQLLDDYFQVLTKAKNLILKRFF